MSNITFALSQEQLSFYKQISKSNDNFFVTGKAGTGKSVLLRYLIKHLQKRTAVVAPTGIAAINAQGQTIHSFFGLNTTVQNTGDPEALHKGLDRKRLDILQSLEVLVIDEISMVRVDIMDMIDAKLRVAKRNNLPFGGCQIVAFGDLYQLPPVVGKEKEVEQYLEDRYHTIFFFGCEGCRKKPFIRLELTTVFRQKDQRFIDILNQVRVGEISAEHLFELNKRVGQHQNESGRIVLTPTNAAAKKINAERLNALHGEPMLYRGFVEGDFSEEEMPTDFILQLKTGAQIMMIKNDSKRRWVNGSIGTIVSLTEDSIRVQIKDSGTFIVDKEVWTKYVYEYDQKTGKLEQKPIGTFRQYPVRLAYAMTIHKSQGQTYDLVTIDYSDGGAFSAGQTYVALSRCRTMNGLALSSPLVHDDIKVNQEVVAYMHGTIELPPIVSMPLPKPKKQNLSAVSARKTSNGSLIVRPEDLRPKKITGRRLPGLLGFDKYNSPFKIWCEIMRVYEEPFEPNKFTIAGETIEPKQYDYVRSMLAARGRRFISPKDLFGENPTEATNFDFFRFAAVFGGMWDYLMEEDGKIKAVFEMKTKQAKNRLTIQKSYPRDLILQAALYAYLLGVEDFYMVTSYLEPMDYDDPRKYNCTPNNTTVDRYSLSSYFGDFESQIIKPALLWYDTHIETGISPIPSSNGDFEIMRRIEESNAKK